MKKNIALLAGGYSGEYVISLKTAKTIEQNLPLDIYNIYKIIVTKEGKQYPIKGADEETLNSTLEELLK